MTKEDYEKLLQYMSNATKDPGDGSYSAQYSDFDIEQHKEKYIHYFEAVIFPDGTVRYAVPSHQEMLIRIACEQNNWTREELDKATPKEYYSDFIFWLCKITGCIPAWENHIAYASITDRQIAKLKELKKHGIYAGSIPENTEANTVYGYFR